jgi:hypothetical protein
MNQESEQQSPEFDAEALYLEENITDRRVGSIRRLVPITRSGEPDSSRPTVYSGMAQVMTAAGPMPLNFDIPGDNLDEVCNNFSECAQVAVEDMAQKLEDMRRDQASQIVVPGQGTSGGSGIIGV